MAKSKKKRTAGKPVAETPNSKAIDSHRQGRWTGFIIAAMVVAILLIIFGFFYYQEYMAPFRRTIITVDDTSIRMDYFLKRARLAGADPMSMLTALTNEQLIRLAAPQYGIKVSAEDIDQALRSIAGGESGNITESEFKEWYRQQLNDTEFSDSEYREGIATALLASRLQEYLAERMPTVAEQVHLNAILLMTYEDAAKIRARWEAGEDFAALAREVSLDEQAKDNGGDIGWFPRGILPSGLDYAAFNLSTDNVSEPIAYTSDPSSTEAVYVYYLLMVSEKAAARELDENFREVLKSNLLANWLTEEIQYHTIKYRGLHNGFDSETSTWINWQLAKSKPSSTGQEQTGQ